MTLAELLRSRRKSLGLTQAQAADLAGVGARLVYELEQGSTSVQLDKLLQVLQALGLHLVVRRGTSTDVVVDA